MASHYNDPGIKYGHSREKGAVDADVAEKVKQKIVTQARAAQRQGVPITQDDIARLVAYADLESGFNPDAANKDESPSGVFQIADETAKDFYSRLNGKSLINGYQVKGNYEDYKRFDPDSNIAVGIGVYLDKKRKAKSDDVNKIYKRWNPGATPAEQKALRKLYEKYKSMKLSLDDSGSDADKVAEAAERDSGRTAPAGQPDDTYSTEDRKRKDLAAGDDAEAETARRGDDSGEREADDSTNNQDGAFKAAANGSSLGIPEAPWRHALDVLGVKFGDVQLTPAEADEENETPDSFDIRDNDTTEKIGSYAGTPTGCEMTVGDRKVVMDRISGNDIHLQTYAKNDDGEYELLGTTRIGDNDGVTVRRTFV